MAGVCCYRARVTRLEVSPIKKLSLSLFLAACPALALAGALEEIHREGEQKIQEARRSQEKVDAIVRSAQERLIVYRSLVKQAEGLETYNTQLATQLANQRELLERLEASMAQVALIERQMSPLIGRMTESLRQFVERDLPFHAEERKERLAFLMDNQGAADLSVAEKFRQVIEAYQIENEYGRKIDSWQDIVRIDGADHEVDVARIGRIALLCQTRDTRLTGYWDNITRQWRPLESTLYRNPVRYAIKMARKQLPIDLLVLPVRAPEDVE